MIVLCSVLSGIEDWVGMEEMALRQHFETNFFAPLLITQQFLQQLKGQRAINPTGYLLVVKLNHYKTGMPHTIFMILKSCQQYGRAKPTSPTTPT